VIDLIYRFFGIMQPVRSLIVREVDLRYRYEARVVINAVEFVPVIDGFPPLVA
jgi:hypothetical protein